MKLQTIVLIVPFLLVGCEKTDGGKWVNKGNECLFTTADHSMAIHVQSEKHLYFTDFQEDCYELSGHTNSDTVGDNPVMLEKKVYSAGMYCMADRRFPAIQIDTEGNERRMLSVMLANDKARISLSGTQEDTYVIPTKGLKENCAALFSVVPGSE